MSGLARYREFLRTPYAATLLGGSILARLPVVMASLGLILLVRDVGGSYAEAGAVAAAYTVGIAVGLPYSGRRVDRVGPYRVLVPRAVLYPCLLGGTAILAILDAPPLALMPFAAAAGLSVAPVASSLRTLWSRLGDHVRQTAYALEAALQEVLFVVGPLAVAALASIETTLGIATTCALALLATLGFARLEPVRTSPGEWVEGGGRLGALALPGIRAVVLISLSIGLAFGGTELAIVAFADEEGNRALGGVVLAAFAAGSLVGGLVTGLRPTADQPRRVLVSLAVFSALLALPLLANSVWVLTAIIFVVGVPIAPLTAASYGVIADLSAGASIAEAFAWLSTAVMTGVAAGTVAGGLLVDVSGPDASFLLGVFAGVLALGIALTFRGSLRSETLAVA